MPDHIPLDWEGSYEEALVLLDDYLAFALCVKTTGFSEHPSMVTQYLADVDQQGWSTFSGRSCWHYLVTTEAGLSDDHPHKWDAARRRDFLGHHATIDAFVGSCRNAIEGVLIPQGVQALVDATDGAHLAPESAAEHAWVERILAPDGPTRACAQRAGLHATEGTPLDILWTFHEMARAFGALEAVVDHLADVDLQVLPRLYVYQHVLPVQEFAGSNDGLHHIHMLGSIHPMVKQRWENCHAHRMLDR